MITAEQARELVEQKYQKDYWRLLEQIEEFANEGKVDRYTEIKLKDHHIEELVKAGYKVTASKDLRGYWISWKL